MRRIASWDNYFSQLVVVVATRSKDPETQVGAVLVREQRILSTGYNGFPSGAAENDQLWQRPHKYDRVFHAELNAIAYAARAGIAIEGSTLYVTHHPCLQCAKVIIAAGIVDIWTFPRPEWRDRYADDLSKAKKLLEESGVAIEYSYWGQ